ncbi:unnamed protein product [Ambrosiozyma monospora]|uniref:Unnamed protein product n=1 Tax=Ambrosiozyma monospora TaxID=43982 RepID=A0A9W6Z3X2_AMBMO|nr:unnamed protein product [Ambrosiozyma monospora]
MKEKLQSIFVTAYLSTNQFQHHKGRFLFNDDGMQWLNDTKMENIVVEPVENKSQCNGTKVKSSLQTEINKVLFGKWEIELKQKKQIMNCGAKVAEEQPYH